MAADNSTNNADYQFHKSTYDGVCAMFKYSIIALVILLLSMAWLLV